MLMQEELRQLLEWLRDDLRARLALEENDELGAAIELRLAQVERLLAEMRGL